MGPIRLDGGVMPVGCFVDEDDAVTQTTLAVNLWGAINGIKLVAPAMVGRGSGHIVNVASLMGRFPLPGLATYTATKAAVVGLSAAVREELDGTGVTVTAVLPSAVATELISGIALPPVKPEQVARAIVGSCEDRPAEIVVPAWAGAIERLSRLMPARLVGFARRFAGHDRAVHADVEARRLRAARPSAWGSELTRRR